MPSLLATGGLRRFEIQMISNNTRDMGAYFPQKEFVTENQGYRKTR